MKKDIEFDCNNDLRITIKKDTGEQVIDEDCCTALTLMLKNNGELATSFLGAHNPQIVRVIEKSMKKYLKVLKSTLKQRYRDENVPFERDNITISPDNLSEDKKWTPDSPVPNVEKKSNTTKAQPNSKANKNETKNKKTINSKNVSSPKQTQKKSATKKVTRGKVD